MQLQTIPKHLFKAKALEYLRLVENKGVTLTITNFGVPVVKVSPYKKQSSEDILKELRAKFKLVKYIDPLEPVGLEDWEVLK